MSYGTASLLGSPGSGIPSGSTGAVGGPASAANNEVAVFDGTTGKLIKQADGPITLSPVGAEYVTVVGNTADTAAGGLKVTGGAGNSIWLSGSVITGGNPALWMFVDATAPSSTNYRFLANSTSSIFNAPSGGLLRFRINNADYLTLNATQFSLDSGVMMNLPGCAKRVSTQFDKTNETLANVTGLSIPLAASTSYRYRAVLFTTSDVSGGVKAAIASSGTVTSIVYEGFTHSGGLITQTRATASGTAVGAITAVTAATIIIEGVITTNSAGNLTVQFARNAAAGTSSVLVGSYIQAFGL